MKSLWTKFLTGIAVAGTLFTMTASASAGGKGFSFGGGGGGGSSMRSNNFGGNSGGQSMMKSFSARSLGGNSGSSFKKLNSSGSSLAGGLNQNQFKVRSLGGNGNGNSQFQNLSKSLKSGNRQFNQNLGSQLLGNSNQLKGAQRFGQFNGQNNKTLDQMLSGARNFQGLKSSNKNNGLQGLVGGQFGNNKQFNPAKFNGLNKHANFFGGNFDKHNHNSNKSFFFGNHHHHGHHHNNLWWGWNNWCGPSYYDPWCYRPYYTNYCYPYYGSYPYYNSSVTYVTPAVAPQPAVAAPEQAPQLPLADLVLADLRVMDPGNGADLGPLFQITIANQGPSASPAFQAAIVAAVSKEQLESAVKATAQVGPIEPSQTTKVEIRLPVEAMALQGPSGPAMFELLGVVLDDLNQVDELDEKNNRGLVNRDKIRPIDGAPAPQAAANPSLAASSANPPRLLSLPPQ